MKAYEISIGMLSLDGRYEGKQRIGFTLDHSKVAEIINNYRAEHEKGYFYIGHETVLNDDGSREIKFYIEEVEVV